MGKMNSEAGTHTSKFYKQNNGTNQNIVCGVSELESHLFIHFFFCLHTLSSIEDEGTRIKYKNDICRYVRGRVG